MSSILELLVTLGHLSRFFGFSMAEQQLQARHEQALALLLAGPRQAQAPELAQAHKWAEPTGSHPIPIHPQRGSRLGQLLPLAQLLLGRVRVLSEGCYQL